MTGPVETPRPLDLRLVPAALAVWAGTLLVLYGGWVSGVVAAGAALLAALACWCWGSGSGLRGSLAVLVLAGAATGAVSVRACWVQHHPLREAAEQQEQVTIRVELREKPRPRQGVAYGAHRAQERSIATATLRTLQRDGSPLRVGGKVVLFVPTSSWRHLIAGQQLTVTGRAVPPRAGELTVAAVQAFRPPSEVTEPPGWQRAAEDLREGLQRAADRVLSPAAAGLLPGLVFGDTTALPPEVQQQFLDAGLTHLTSVSGANLAIVCGAVLFVLRGVGAGPVLSAMAGAAGLVGFVVLAGPEPSVLRAAVMGGVALLALAVGRERSALPALATSVIGLLLVRPELASRWGFALSVAATAGLVLLVPGWADALNRRGVPPGVAEALAVPAAAHLATAPLVVSFSGELSLVAVGANLLASPLVAPATVLGVLATATATALPRFADFLVWLTAPELEAVLFIGERSAAVPGAVVNWPSGLLGGLLLAAASVVLLGFLRSQRLRAVLGALVVVAVLVLVPVRTLRPHWPATDWSVVVCDVGQGDSLVLSTGVPGEAVVVDTGPAPDTTADCLRRLGVNKIPLVILTHLHADHTGGLAGVLAGRSVGAVGIGPLRKPEWALDEVLQRTRQQHVPVMTLTAGHRARWPGLDIEVLGPSGALAASRDEQDANDASLVVMATTEAGRVLLTGDIELRGQGQLLATGAELRAEVLKVPHHGSRFTSPRFLQAVRPRLAVISVGADNDYGHPSSHVINELTAAGTRVLRTDERGDIAVLPGPHGLRYALSR